MALVVCLILWHSPGILLYSQGWEHLFPGCHSFINTPGLTYHPSAPPDHLHFYQVSRGCWSCWSNVCGAFTYCSTEHQAFLLSRWPSTHRRQRHSQARAIASSGEKDNPTIEDGGIWLETETLPKWLPRFAEADTTGAWKARASQRPSTNLDPCWPTPQACNSISSCRSS